MEKLIKKLLSLVLCISLMTFLVASASGVEPRLIYLSDVTGSLSIDSTNKATCYGVVSAKQLTQPVRITCLLQQNINGTWKTLYSWDETGTYKARIDHSRYVYSGYYYRVCFTGYILDADGNTLEEKTVTHTVDYRNG